LTGGVHDADDDPGRRGHCGRYHEPHAKGRRHRHEGSGYWECGPGTLPLLKS
jgi:hypothetical protein